jgi:hypothetical protein
VHYNPRNPADAVLDLSVGLGCALVQAASGLLGLIALTVAAGLRRTRSALWIPFSPVVER